MSTTTSEYSSLAYSSTPPSDPWRRGLEAVTAIMTSSDVEMLAQTIRCELINTLSAVDCVYMVVETGMDSVRFDTATPPFYFPEIVHRAGISTWLRTWSDPEIIQDIRTLEWKPYIQSAKTNEASSALIVPTPLDASLYGLLVVFGRTSDSPFINEDLELAALLTKNISLTVKRTLQDEKDRLDQASLRTRQLGRELVLAGEIQRALLPRNVPHVPGLSLNVYSAPSAEVGGDFHDILTVQKKYLGFAVGDVAGKGIPGAIMMASLYTAFHEYATDPLMTASDVMSRVNELIHNEASPDRFATLFYGVLSLKTGTIRYCNAGHTPPILCRSDGTIEYLSTGGLVLGPFPEAIYSLGEIQLFKGDILVLYTDGLTEARNDDLEEFGIHRLNKVIQSCPGLSAEEVKECLTNTLQAHVGHSPQHDDITIIVLKVNKDFQHEIAVV